MINTIEIRQYDKVRARFTPTRTDDLRDASDVGKVGTFQAVWIIEDGPYIGEWAMSPDRESGISFAWCPLSDLTLDV